MKVMKLVFLSSLYILLIAQLAWTEVGYIVKDGDTLSGIAAKFHVEEADLISANNFEDGFTLKEGLRLIIPYSKTPENEEIVQEEEQSQSDEVTISEYEVKPNDCLAKIANEFDCTVDDICKCNGLERDSIIYIGQIIKIPKTNVSSNDENILSEDQDIPIETNGGYKKALQVKVHADKIKGINLLDLSELEGAEIIVNETIVEPDENISEKNPVKKIKDESQKVSVIKKYVQLPGEPDIVYVKHKVIKDDTISKLSRKYDTSEEAIFRANNINRHTILNINDELLIPVVKTGKEPKEDDNLISRNLAPRDRLIRKALEYEGLRRIRGGSSLSRGVDCSGFTMKIYKLFGVTLPHSAREQARMGKKVDRKNLLPGDLIFFSSPENRKRISHVGFYIGGGYVLHVSSISRRVKKDKLSSDYFSKHYITARRYL